MKLFQQVQQFKLFFKNNILIYFKTSVAVDTVQPFTLQLQNNFSNISNNSKPNNLSFLNNHNLNINLPTNLNNLINNDYDNTNYNYTSNKNNDNDYNETVNEKINHQQQNLKINMIHPIYSTIADSNHLTSNIYYQYLPIPLKSKSKYKSNSSLPDKQSHIHSSASKKELQHSISLPNLMTSSLTTGTTTTTSTDLSNYSNLKHQNSYDLNDRKKEDEHGDEISLCSIKTIIEQNQHTLKKLQKKVITLQKENQDLLNKILTKRKAKEQNNSNTELISKSLNIQLSLQQIKIIK